MSNSRTERNSILCVGLSCLDFINVCNHYPKEDSDQRSISQRWQRGGNAANNTTVLSQLFRWNQNFDFKVEYLGTMSDDFAAKFISEDFKKEGIITENVVIHKESSSPTSSVIVNLKNGSRTIVHYNEDLPDLTFESFSKLCLNKYKHIHFDARNVEEVKKMISFIRKSDPMREIKISIELEPAKNELLNLLNQDVDLFFVEKDFVSLLNCTNIDETIKVIAQRVHSTAIVICPWAESGAKAIDNQNKQICSSPAFKPKTGVVDSLGAGDTFLAATLFALQILNYKLQEAIEFGCRVAGAKCGAHGFQHLHKFQEYI